MTEWTDTDLANACVELGVLKRYPDDKKWWIYAIVDGEPGGKVASEIVHDWRVAGACLQRWPTTISVPSSTKYSDWTLDQMPRDPRMIIEGYVEALT